MSRHILPVCLSLCLAAISVSAQQMESASGVEIGTLFGLSRFSTDGDAATLIGLPSAPGSSIAGNPSIYVAWFPNDRLSIGPEVSLGRFSVEQVSFTSVYLAGRTEFHSGGVATSGAYILGRGALRHVSAETSGDSDAATDFGLGAGVGYRWRVGSSLVVRAEGGYRRWFEEPGTNDFSLLLGIGGKAGRVATVQDSRSSQPEIGTFFGLSRFSSDGEGATLVGLPSALGSSVTGNPSIYVTWFVDERFSIGPEFSLGRTSGDGDAIMSLYLAGRTEFHSGGDGKSGPYVSGRGALRVVSAETSFESESDTDISVGAGVGYRWRVGGGLVVRAEGGYRRWFDDAGTNDLSLVLGLGASISGN